MTIVLTDSATTEIAGSGGAGALWASAADAERALGWTLKPEGMCRDDACVPLPAGAVRDGSVDLAAFWRRMGAPAVGDATGAVWSFGAAAEERKRALGGLEAPDFTLPDVEGVPHRLSDLRGRKVLLVTWASW
jgi:hypothetical protein